MTLKTETTNTPMGDTPMARSVFGWVATVFPTRAIAGSRLAAFVWRLLFYGFRPRKPFRFATPHYELWAIPDRRSLTRAVIRRGTWEKIETRVFIALLDEGGDFIDVGANFGHYAMVASNVLGPEARIFAFEPSPGAFAELVANIGLQPHANVSAHRLALSDGAGTATFYLDGANPGGNSLGADNLGTLEGSFEVATAGLDGFLAERAGPGRRIGLIKSDCQGADFKVLRGARDTLARHRPYLLTEFWPHGMRACGEDPRVFIAMIGALDYLPFFMSPRRAAMAPITPAAMQSYPSPGEPDYLELLLVPAEKLAAARRRLGPLLARDDGGPRF